MAQGVWRGVRARARAPPPALCSVAQRTESAPLAPDMITPQRRSVLRSGGGACASEQVGSATHTSREQAV